jgi:hypothetical protein
MPASDLETQSRITQAKEPLALIPPALDQLLGLPARSPSVVAALRSLGFSSLLYVADGLAGYYAELKGFARSRNLERLLVTACPPASALLHASFPEIAAQIPSQILPPAERVVKAARKERPGATIFFLSPCSARAKSLDRYVDCAVPLTRIFPDILAALGRDMAEPQERLIAAACALPPGGKRSVAGIECINAFLSGKADPGKGRAASCGPALIEFLACSGGCSEGDWAPRREATRARLDTRQYP